MKVYWLQLHNPESVEKFLQSLYDSYKNVEVIGITKENNTFDIYYKLGKIKNGKQKSTRK